MKKLFSSAAFILITAVIHGQYSFQDINNELVTTKALYAAVPDNNGDLIVFGAFSTSITMDGYTVTNSTPFNPAGQNQMTSFIGKKSGSSFVWLSKIDLLPLSNYSSGVYINGLATDATGNIIMTGVFWGRAQFGSTVLTSTQFAPGYIYGPGYSTDMFVAEMSPNGNFLWANLEGYANEDCVVNGNEMGISVSSDNAGNVYATGRLYPKIIKNTGGTCTGNTPVACAAIFKYSPSGIRLWNRQYSGSQPSKTNKSSAVGWKIVCDGVNTYTTGPMSGTVKFGSTTLSTSSDTIPNTFILRLDPNGNTVWAKSVTNAKNVPDRIIIDNNNLYLTGHFWPGTASFGGITLTNNAVSGYLTKYTTGGVCLWATMPGFISGSMIMHPNGHIAMLTSSTLKEFSTNDGSAVDSTVPSNLQNSKIMGYALTRTQNGYLISENLQGSYDYGGITITSTQPVGSSYYDMIIVSYSTPAPPVASPGNILSETSLNKTILYPNPTSNQIIIQNNNNKLLGTVRIYDISGKMIYKKFIGSFQTTIDVKNFSAGIYYLKSDQLQATLKFIKQ
ncbi:MAG: T9SS type A sorting domain-containing protein [Chitinophagaceae bacterium]|nr:MAG: T9SS type A sorting domain-containing protein [Chitinophagaceae bacterium]